MRLVLDTNVLIAALIAHGTCNELVEYCFIHHQVVMSKGILYELSDVLTRKFGFTTDTANQATALFEWRAEIVDTNELHVAVCRDKKDDHILATAQTANALVIITGDKDLLDLETFDQIQILKPTDFWQFERAHEPRDA
jgi:putative PIN family toxin of toxin-antitoxin system